MDISGKIIQKLPLQQGESKTSGKPWALQAYVLETQEQFPRKVCFEIFGEQRIKDNPCDIDDIVTVSFDIESREFNGRWYTSIRAWKVQQGVVDGAAQLSAPAPVAQDGPVAPAAQPMGANIETFDAAADNNDGLPF